MYLFSTPILASYAYRYGINYLKEEGYEIELMDLSNLLAIQAYKEVKSGLLEYEGYKVILCKDKKHLVGKISKYEKDTIFLLTFDFYLDVFFIYKELTRNRLDFGYINRMDTNLEVSITMNFREKIRNYILNININKIAATLFNKIPRKWLKLKSAEFIVLGGNCNSEFYRKITLCDDKTRTIYLHSLDYEEYLKAKQIKNSQFAREKYCVFLDQYTPYHPDGISMGIKMNPDIYYKELRNIFRIIEEQYGLKVLIAAHPRSDYSKHPEAYQKYPVYKYMTAEMILYSEFVLTQYSTAQTYAILANKPMLFLYSDELINFKIYLLAINAYSKETGAPKINISHTTDSEIIRKIGELKIDGDLYKQYIYNYIKKTYGDADDNKPFWELFEEHCLIS